MRSFQGANISDCILPTPYYHNHTNILPVYQIICNTIDKYPRICYTSYRRGETWSLTRDAYNAVPQPFERTSTMKRINDLQAHDSFQPGLRAGNHLHGAAWSVRCAQSGAD